MKKNGSDLGPFLDPNSPTEPRKKVRTTPNVATKRRLGTRKRPEPSHLFFSSLPCHSFATPAVVADPAYHLPPSPAASPPNQPVRLSGRCRNPLCDEASATLPSVRLQCCAWESGFWDVKCWRPRSTGASPLGRNAKMAAGRCPGPDEAVVGFPNAIGSHSANVKLCMIMREGYVGSLLSASQPLSFTATSCRTTPSTSRASSEPPRCQAWGFYGIAPKCLGSIPGTQGLGCRIRVLTGS